MILSFSLSYLFIYQIYFVSSLSFSLVSLARSRSPPITMVMSGYSWLVPRVAGWWFVRKRISSRMSSMRCSGNCHTKQSWHERRNDGNSISQPGKKAGEKKEREIGQTGGRE